MDDNEDIQIHRGMRLVLTRNVDKAAGLVNGTMVHVREWNDSLMVTTPTQRDIMLPLQWEYVEERQSCFYPVVPGYAFTLAKMHGETLPHMCLWPDVTHVPGAAYTAVTMVRTADALVLLTPIRRQFCVPSGPLLFPCLQKEGSDTLLVILCQCTTTRQHTHPDDMNCAFVHNLLKGAPHSYPTTNINVDRGLCDGAQGTVLALHNHSVIINFGHWIDVVHVRSEWTPRGLKVGSCLCDDCA